MRRPTSARMRSPVTLPWRARRTGKSSSSTTATVSGRAIATDAGEQRAALLEDRVAAERPGHGVDRAAAAQALGGERELAVEAVVLAPQRREQRESRQHRFGARRPPCGGAALDRKQPEEGGARGDRRADDDPALDVAAARAAHDGDQRGDRGQRDAERDRAAEIGRVGPVGKDDRDREQRNGEENRAGKSDDGGADLAARGQRAARAIRPAPEREREPGGEEELTGDPGPRPGAFARGAAGGERRAAQQGHRKAEEARAAAPHELADQKTQAPTMNANATAPGRALASDDAPTGWSARLATTAVNTASASITRKLGDRTNILRRWSAETATS